MGCVEKAAMGALALLEEMEQSVCQTDGCTYNTLMHGLCMCQHLHQALKLYEVLKSNEVDLESGTYAAFLKAFCRAGKVAEAYQIFDYMLNWKPLPDVVAYYVLVNSMGLFKQPRLSRYFLQFFPSGQGFA